MSDTETDAEVRARALDVLKGRREMLQQELTQANNDVALMAARLDEVDTSIYLLERDGRRKPGRKPGGKNAEKPPVVTPLKQALLDSLAQTEPSETDNG